MKTRALLLLPLLALACRDNSASVQIQSICFPTDDCTFGNACDLVLMGNPRIDTGAAAAGNETLGLFIQVANQAPDNSNEEVGKLNTNDAHVDEIQVEYEGLAIPRQIRLTNQRVPANATQILSVMAVPAGFSAQVTAATGFQVLALLRMRGYWDDGTRFETAEFPIAIDVCTGCSTSCGALSVCGSNDAQEPKTCFDPNPAGTT